MGLPVSRRFQVVFTIAWLCVAVGGFMILVQVAFKLDVYVLRRFTGALMFAGLIGLLVSAVIGAVLAGKSTPVSLPPPPADEPRGFFVNVEPSATSPPIVDAPPPSPIARLVLAWDRSDPRWRLRLLLSLPIMLAYVALDYLILRYTPKPIFAHLFLVAGAGIVFALGLLFKLLRPAGALVIAMVFGFGGTLFTWPFVDEALIHFQRGDLLKAVESIGEGWLPILMLAAGSYVTTALLLPLRGQR